MKKEGFTLIELLVVISIIGLLSSVVFASLTSARKKAADASVKAQLSGMRTAAALLFENTGSFDSLCDSATDTGKIYRASFAQGLQTDGGSLCLESDTSGSLYVLNSALNSTTNAAPVAGKWAAVVLLKGTGKYFCVDYTGIAREQSGRGIDNSNGGVTDYDCN